MNKLDEIDNYWASVEDARDSEPEEIQIDLSYKKLVSFGFTPLEIQEYALDFEYIRSDCKGLANWEIPDFVRSALMDLLTYCTSQRLNIIKDGNTEEKEHRAAA